MIILVSLPVKHQFQSFLNFFTLGIQTILEIDHESSQYLIRDRSAPYKFCFIALQHMRRHMFCKQNQ